MKRIIRGCIVLVSVLLLFGCNGVLPSRVSVEFWMRTYSVPRDVYNVDVRIKSIFISGYSTPVIVDRKIDIMNAEDALKVVELPPITLGATVIVETSGTVTVVGTSTRELVVPKKIEGWIHRLSLGQLSPLEGYEVRDDIRMQFYWDLANLLRGSSSTMFCVVGDATEVSDALLPESVTPSTTVTVTVNNFVVKWPATSTWWEQKVYSEDGRFTVYLPYPMDDKSYVAEVSWDDTSTSITVGPR
ncbi:MAG: hypothetical protein J7L52_04025 [Thermotogae bacterium]|nr:hypothetical protein [Thermotogota bacterium]